MSWLLQAFEGREVIREQEFADRAEALEAGAAWLSEGLVVKLNGVPIAEIPP